MNPRNWSVSRRSFIGALGAAVAAQGCNRLSEPSALAVSSRGSDRADLALEVRRQAAAKQRARPMPPDLTNGDEGRYSNRCASFSKGLPHDDMGHVDPAAYEALLKAIASGKTADFNAVPVGGNLKLTNVEAAYTFTLHGADSHHIGIAASPPFASAESAADMVEVYWQAVMRDVALDSLASSELALAAGEDLSRLSAFSGPKTNGRVTPELLFRGTTPGDTVGPYASQFLFARVPHGVYAIEQQFRMPTVGLDYVTDFADWLAQQRGAGALSNVSLQSELRYMVTGRDLARYVHRDYTFQPFLNAALVLLSYGDEYLLPTPYVPRACAVSREFIATQDGFSTFGPPQVLDAVTAVANLALRACWRQKWLVHRGLRPEVFAARVDRAVNHGKAYPIHHDLLAADVLNRLSRGNCLLPLSYPEGAPCHPSYPSGHAAIAGACVTVLKAFFRTDATFPAPVRPSEDGCCLKPYEGNLTVGGELNKLASNVSIGRNFAGIHYRSDASEGLRLGEAVALSYLADMRQCMTEDFDAFTVDTFDGSVTTI
jgi:membrane-associated phospholipid phosphatase